MAKQTEKHTVLVIVDGGSGKSDLAMRLIRDIGGPGVEIKIVESTSGAVKYIQEIKTQHPNADIVYELKSLEDVQQIIDAKPGREVPYTGSLVAGGNETNNNNNNRTADDISDMSFEAKEGPFSVQGARSVFEAEMEYAHASAAWSMSHEGKNKEAEKREKLARKQQNKQQRRK